MDSVLRQFYRMCGIRLTSAPDRAKVGADETAPNNAAKDLDCFQVPHETYAQRAIKDKF